MSTVRMFFAVTRANSPRTHLAIKPAANSPRTEARVACGRLHTIAPTDPHITGTGRMVLDSITCTACCTTYAYRQLSVRVAAEEAETTP